MDNGNQSCDLLPEGDRGQRYEVAFVNLDGEEQRVGWQDAANGPLIAVVEKIPSAAKLIVIDRQENNVRRIVDLRDTYAEQREAAARKRNRRKAKVGKKERGNRKRRNR